MGTLDLIKTKNLLERHQKMKRQPQTDRKKVFANHVSDKERVFRLHIQISQNLIKRKQPTF